MSFDVRVTKAGLALSGELDFAEVEHFGTFAASNVDGSHEVVLDIAELTFLDSSGLRAIMRLAAFECPAGLVLHWPRASVRSLLDLVSIEDVAGIRVEPRPPESPDG